MTRRLVVAGALIRVWAAVKIEPGYGTAEERAAILDALKGPFRIARQTRESTARGTAS